MTDNSSRVPRTAWLGFSFVSGLLGLAVLISFLQINRSRHLQLLPVIGPVADFTLTNQDGLVTTLAAFTNHVWVADIIFTRCAGPCPRLTGQMGALQGLLPAESTAKLVTLTTDPEFDSPAVLKKYGQRFNADAGRWTFLTGDRDDVDQFASRFGVSVSRALNDPRDITHNLRTVIIGADGRLLKVYTGNEWTPEQVLADLRQ